MPFLRPLGERDGKSEAPNFIRPLNDKRAVVGERVVLECQLEGHPEPFVKWLKDNHNVTACPDYQIEEDGKKHRLIIANVQGADSGRFTAQALNTAGNQQSTCILIVAPAPTPIPGAKPINSPAPPQTPVGPSAPIFLKELRHQPLNPGNLLVLEARVLGQPVPTIEWLKNGKPLQNYRAKVDYHETSGIVSMTIPQMFTDDVGEYTCKASNQHGEASSVAQLLPRDQYERWFSNEQKQLTKDRKQNMMAQTARPASAAQRQMMRHGYAYSDTESYGDMTWAVSESETEPELAALESKNAPGTKPILRTPLRGLRLTEGTDAILQANIVGNPKPKISWLKNGHPLSIAGPRMQVTFKGTMALLKISMVLPEDSGDYTVLADNKFGKVDSSARIEVYPLSVPDERPLLTPQPTKEQQAQAQLEQQYRREQQAAFERKEREEREAQARREVERRRQQIEEEQRRREEAHRRLVEEEQRKRAEQERFAEEQRRRQQQQQQQFEHERALEEQRRRQQAEQERIAEQQRRRDYEQRVEQQRLEEQRRRHVEQERLEQERRRQLQLQQQQQQQELEDQRRRQQQAPAQIQQQQPEHYVQQVPQQQAPWRQQTHQQQVYQQPQQQIQQVHLVQPQQPQYRQQTYAEPYVSQHQPQPVHTYHQPQQRIPSGQSAYEQHIRQRDPHHAQKNFTQIGQQQSNFEPQQQRYEQERYYQQQQPHQYQYPEQQYYDMSSIKRQQQQQQQQIPNTGIQMITTDVGAAGSTAYVAPKPGQLAGKSAKPPIFIVHPQSVAAKIGDQIVFSAKATGDPLPQMEWMHADGSPVPTSGRVRGEVFSDGSGRLSIDKVEAEDADTYLCVARNSGGSMQSRFSLNVLQTRSPDAPQFTGRFQSTTINEGDTLKLYCKASGENLKYEWSKDNDKIGNAGHFKVASQGNETTLIIENATIAEGGWYQCVASNQFGSTPLKGRIVVQGRKKLAPHQRELITLRKVDRKQARTPVNQMEQSSSTVPQFQGQLQQLNLVEGQSARLEIKYAPADDPNLKIAWLKDGRAILASSRVVTMAEFGIAVLEINPVNAFDQGDYTIVAVNTLGEARQDTHIQVTGHAQVTPRQTPNIQQMGQSYGTSSPAPGGKLLEMPNFHSELRSQEVFEGHPIHLECKLTPLNDPSLRTQWFLNGQALSAGSRIRVTHEFGFACLDIADASAQDAGSYTVVAANELGQSENSATILVHPKNDLLAYEGNRNLDVDDVRQIQYQQTVHGEAPQFLRPPQSFHCEQELGRSYFEARITPINDPSLRVSWLKDGHALPSANRIQTSVNFGCVSLTLHPTYPEDAGVYTIVLHNVLGTAQASAELTTYQTEQLREDTLHEQSLNMIGYLDSHQVHIGPQPVERPEEERSLEQPKFARNLGDRLEVNENEPVHFEARILPASDVKMQVEWYHNGHPLAAAHRFRPMFDFGYVALDILYAYPEDSGTYTLVAKNELGDAQCSVELAVNSEKTLYLDAHHPEGLSRIQELEQNRIGGLAEVEDRTCDNAPQFLGDLQNIQLNEMDDIHLDIKVTPVNDPTMVVEWFVNGAPLLTGSRVKAMYEFGFIALDIKGAISEDTGTYTVRVTNALGEASKQCDIVVMPAGTILSDTHHEESLGKINYLENLNKYGREEVEEQGPEGPPQFILQLPGDIGEVEEGEPLHLECQVRPYNDNSLKITWLRDGKTIPHGHRFRTFYDFGYVSLDILGVYAQDSGVYTCFAENSLGSAETSTKFVCHAKDNIMGQTQHPNSYRRIQEIEAPKPLPEDQPEQDKQAPQFVKELGPGLQVQEGDNVYLEAQVIPTDDNTITYEWLLNGAPLMKAHRYVLSQDFGFIALNILYVYPEDSGTYTLIVRNGAGEARSTVDIQCAMKGGMITDSFHPSSIQRIQELETPQQRAEAAPDAPKQAPQIVKPLPSSMDVVHESQTLHLEAQVSPVDDNTLRYEWFYNGHPLKMSSRYRMMHDFGFVSLDIDYIIADDEGTYTLRVSNEAGQAETTTQFTVDRLKSIVTDTAHPESLRRIQEIEALQPAKPSDEDAPLEPPVFTQQLQGPTEILKEGQSVHMDCVVQPINDPNLRIEWFHNDRPLQFGSRIRTIHDFGYVGLEFLHVHPEDTGVYTCRAANSAGDAHTQFAIECKPKRNIYLDTQHAESWNKIQEMENREEIREPSPELTFPPPQFTEQLKSLEAPEGDSIRLECRLVPVNDPTLKVYWTCNGQPLPEASRFMPARNFDYVNLDILGVNATDTGLYECKAISEFGEASTTCEVTCEGTANLMLDTQHQESWNRIQDMENRPVQEPIFEEAEKIAPRFVVPLNSNMGEFNEGVPIHLECQVEPTNDNKLITQWFHNGAPLANGHRFRTTHDFGYVALDILYAFAQDAGEWACQAINELGEAQTVAAFNVIPRGTIYQDTQHPESWARIQEIEAPKAGPAELPDVEHEAPQFIEPMESLERIEFQSAHFQTRVTPFTDPKMRIQWLKDGQPLHNSNRFKLTTDFGYIALDIAHTVPEDSGTYTVIASNEKGDAQVQANLTVQGNAGILGDTQHEQSWQKIQVLEAPKEAGPEAPEIEHGPPKFIRSLNSVDNVIEGQPAHFEAQFVPFADPNTTVQWFLNGQPLGASNRRILRSDFGLVTLDLQYVLGEDSGEYSVVAKNRAGEDRASGSLTCQARPSIIGDTHHAQSWQRIQDLEAPREAPAEAPAPTYQKPTFTQPLQSVDGLKEGGVALLEAKVIPVNDPNLRIEWFFNDTPLPESNWIAINNDFGNVSLRIAPTYARHTGVYSCRATNAEGAAVTSAQITVQGEDGLLLDTRHPDSLRKIQEMEAIDKNARIEAPEREFEKPQWVQGFQNYDDVQEGQVVELHGLVEPSGDPHLRIEWLLNGQPLLNANRFRQEYEFGNAILTIVHVLPHDSGVYTCRAWNAQGEDSTSATVKVAGYERLLLDTQHPSSWQRIQEIEAPKEIEEVEDVIMKEKPYFLTQIESVTDVLEGTPVHLEATFQPARDADLQVIWEKNGNPVPASQLVQTKHELGWATLDILSVNPDHEGIYTLRIKNSEGEAVSSAAVKVAGTSGILGDTRHEESWRRIQILEAPKELEPEAPAPVYDHPAINTQLVDIECEEGDHIHFEAVIVPVNDPNLKVQWIRNGQPLGNGSKYAISQDFGICMLDIGYTFPEDAGVYQLKIWNDQGEAVSSATLKCTGKEAILGDTQHAESWARIQEIEAPKPEVEEAAPVPKAAPRFITEVQSPGELNEGQPAHFEATIEPIDDPNMQIQWFLNGAPVSATSRVKTINDFGWVILDINHIEVRDSGEWRCVARNAAGEASSTCSLNVQGKDSLYLDSLQPQSLQRISEIEAPRPVPEEAPIAAPDAPVITNQLTVQGDVEEGGSAHLQAQYTPVNDPRIKVEWLLNGQPIHHSNRYKMVNDFGFAILEILHVMAHDAGEYTLRVSNESGEATSSTSIAVDAKSGLLLQPQNEQKAKAVEVLEENLNRRPEEIVEELKEVMPVFVEPLSAPISCEEGDRAHFTARYEPVNDNQLQVQWYLNGRPLKTGSRVKTISDFGYVVLEISPVYPEDSGEYTCRAVNRVGEAVTSTTLTCSGKERIISQSQLPERMSGAQTRIAEIEAPKPLPEDVPDVDHGPPKFITALVSPPELQEGQSAHLEAQVVPVADPRLKIEWFHEGQPMRNSNRMKMIHDFGFVVLELSPAEPQDTGRWKCVATNEHGSAECEADLKVVGTGGVSYEWQSPAERKERINQLEDWIHRPKEDLSLPPQEFEAPHFTQDLIDLGTLNEADATSFVCVLEPIGDPTLRVQWEHNGHAIPYSNRISMTNEFGVATLLIKHLIAADAGEYRCVATTSKGQAVSVGKVEVESVTKIDAPQIIQPLVDKIENVAEGDSVHLECRVTPINDPSLKVQWLRDGAPLPEASRFKPTFEFGFASLDILYAYPEDSGDYELVVVNEKGQAASKSHVTILPGTSLEFAPQAHGSRQDNLESHFRQHSTAALQLTVDDGYDENAKKAPEFKTNLVNIGVSEGDFCRFETQVAPVNDPYMKLEWYKDKKPVLMGHRFRSTLDFGYAALDLLYALPDDTGEYHCVATNKYGQAMVSAKLACQSGSHVITESQMPQGLNVTSVKRDQQNLHWQDQGAVMPKQKMAPQFTIKPRNTQVTENQPARFECAVVGNPKPKVIWYINGNQALHGHRYKLNFDGLHYLTISNSRVSDAGEIVAIARNSEGEVLASCNLDIFQNDDFRQHKLKPATFKTNEELQEREKLWQKETLGKLGEHFETAPKADAQKLMHVERARSPLEPLETEELMQKFTRPKEELYEKLSYVETTKPTFKGMELEEVRLKAGTTNRFEPTKESLPTVALKVAPSKKTQEKAVENPDWAQDGGKKLQGANENKFKRVAEQPKEVNVPARDQVRLNIAKPTRAEQVNEGEHVKIAEDKAKLKGVQQGPEQPKEVVVPHKEQVQMKSQGAPKVTKTVEHVTLEEKNLKDTPPVQKAEIAETKISNKHTLFVQAYRERSESISSIQGSSFQMEHLEVETQSSHVQKIEYEFSPRPRERVIGFHMIRPQPRSMGTSQKAPPSVSQQLKPIQSELGKSAKFFVAFEGALPIKVTWFKDGKELKSSFRNQISNTNTGSTLNIGRLENSHDGEYTVRLENVAGTVESMANLNLAAPVDKGKSPDFSAKLNDLRATQNGPAEFSCQISGEPKPTINWFKDGQPLPNDGRFVPSEANGTFKLSVQSVHPQDTGVYECVAKNPAGEARCKARLNVNLSKTGKGAEEGPRLEAPRFAVQIQPVIGNDGQSSSFSAKYTGFPEPTIRWYRNNEPIKKVGYNVSQKNGEATLTILSCKQEDVAEYKIEASNPAGKASSVANLVLAPKSGRITKTTITRGGSGGTGTTAAPQFLSKLSDINARQGHTVKFSCEISGDPMPTVQWTFNGRPLTGGRDLKINLDGIKATLELARVNQASAGTYECVIKNPNGTAQCQAKLNLAR